jgi:hypothetical protein
MTAGFEGFQKNEQKREIGKANKEDDFPDSSLIYRDCYIRLISYNLVKLMAHTKNQLLRL